MLSVIYAEVKNKDGAWEKVGNVFESSYEQMDGKLTDRVCDKSNIVLFEILTGIKSSQNNTLKNMFGGIRGIPADVSSEVKKKFDALLDKNEFMMFSYASLSELMQYNWDENFYYIGIISEWQYKRMKEKGINPIAVRSHILDLSAKIVNPVNMDVILKYPRLREDKRYYVNIEYDCKSIQNECEFFYTKSLPKLIDLVPSNGTVDDVRIVYAYYA